MLYRLYFRYITPLQVVKNIVLAGVNLTIQDSNVVTNEDFACNFFLTMDDLGKEVSLSSVTIIVEITFSKIATAALAKVKDLNTFANIDCVTSKLDDLPDEFFSQYSVILMSGCSEVCV